MGGRNKTRKDELSMVRLILREADLWRQMVAAVSAQVSEEDR